MRSMHRQDTVEWAVYYVRTEVSLRGLPDRHMQKGVRDRILVLRVLSNLGASADNAEYSVLFMSSRRSQSKPERRNELLNHRG